MQNNKEKKNVFEIENLSFAYDKHEVLNNLNLSFHEGIVTTMIGLDQTAAENPRCSS